MMLALPKFEKVSVISTPIEKVLFMIKVWVVGHYVDGSIQSE